MLIVGVDPGSNATGFGIIRKEGTRSVHVASGVIRASTADSHPKRLHRIYRKLDEVLQRHQPQVMVVESLFHGNNSQSLMKLSQVRGVVLLAGEMHGLDIFEYAPMEIKAGLTGYGRAEKDQMVFMVGRILCLPDLKSPDEADALAMALYHSHRCLPERCAL
ncbi:MAG: crossover junction endodeoxyribonuclease RuvC [Desulfomonile tiedjei]|nr:crossover junction endodeoxyribonuclease RuvC [Desulfomonile tiedjei]